MRSLLLLTRGSNDASRKRGVLHLLLAGVGVAVGGLVFQKRRGAAAVEEAHFRARSAAGIDRGVAAVEVAGRLALTHISLSDIEVWAVLTAAD